MISSNIFALGINQIENIELPDFWIFSSMELRLQ